MQIRGGSSKGIYFLKSDLPSNEYLRNEIILDVIGRDQHQIDGLGGATSLTSKVAIVTKSDEANADVEYLFLQVVVGKNYLDTTQNCGNILAGVGPFAIEAGLVKATDTKTDVRVRMLNSGSLCELEISTPQGRVEYEGDQKIGGVSGSAQAIVCNYLDTEGAQCGSLLPTGNVIDIFNSIEVTCVDNGMPVVLLRAEDLAITGNETPTELNTNSLIKSTLESIRIAAGLAMNLGDVTTKTVPKMCIISASQSGSLINTRTFIPHNCHTSIGVLCATSVASACLIPNSVAKNLVTITNGESNFYTIEHPQGSLEISMHIKASKHIPSFYKSGVVRTARLLSKGTLYVPSKHKEVEQ